MHYKIIKTIGELTPYRTEYDQFISKHAENEYYYYLYGNLQSLSEFQKKKTLICIILIFMNEEIIAVAPFQVRRRHIIYLRTRLLQFLGSSNHPLGSKYGCIIYDQGEDRLLINRTIISAMLTSDMPSWDEVYFDNIKCDTNLPLSEYFNYLHAPVSSCYRSPIKFTEDEFLRTYLKRKSRYKLIRSKNNLLNDFENVEFIRLDRYDKKTFDEISRLHSERQRFKRNKSGYKYYYSLFDDPVEKDSLSKLTKWLGNNGMLSLFLLKVNGKIIAFLYCVDAHTISNVLVMAFDNNYQAYSPSKLLTIYAFGNHNLRGSFIEMDFLEDNNLFKQQLCPIEIKRISVNAANYTSILSRIKWKYIRSLKKIILKVKRNNSKIEVITE